MGPASLDIGGSLAVGIYDPIGQKITWSTGFTWNGTANPTMVNNGPFVSGFLHLDATSEPLYITSTNMTSFGSSLGPQGENIILRKINPDSNYGGFANLIIDHLQNDLDCVDCGGVVLKTLRIKLTNSYGELINLHGSNWSFSVVFKETM